MLECKDNRKLFVSGVISGDTKRLNVGQDIVKIVVLMAIVKAADLVGFADVRITELGTASTTKIAINFEEIEYN